MNAIETQETSEALAQCDVPSLVRDEMYNLLDSHFEGVSREVFERDLSEKNWVVTIRRSGRLVGFSTLFAAKTHFEDIPILSIYSGDTIVDPGAWGSPALARVWIATVNRLRLADPGRRCFWLLLTSGFRTYRFLPVFWREFHPRSATPIPPFHARLMVSMARLRYGTQFDEATGVVRFSFPQRLRRPLAGVPEGRANDPHIAYFLSRNPGHAMGDELVCLTEITESNLSRAGSRMVATQDP
jgi:hypothetical protein